MKDQNLINKTLDKAFNSGGLQAYLDAVSDACESIYHNHLFSDVSDSLEALEMSEAFLGLEIQESIQTLRRLSITFKRHKYQVIRHVANNPIN